MCWRSREARIEEIFFLVGPPGFNLIIDPDLVKELELELEFSAIII